MTLVLLPHDISFAIDNDIDNLLLSLDENQLYNFADLYKDTSQDEEVKLSIYTTYLLYKRTRGESHLQKAMQQAMDWVQVMPLDHLYRPQLLRILTHILSEISRLRLVPSGSRLNTARNGNQTSTIQELDFAIRIAKDALSVTPPHHSDQHLLLNDLGCWLGARSSLTMSLQDLNLAVQHFSKALDVIPLTSMHLTHIEFNLASLYVKRFERVRAEADLSKAVSLAETVVQSPGMDRQSLVLVQLNLSSWYHKAYEVSGSVLDLNKAIELGMRTLDIISHDHEERPSLFVNIGTRLMLRHELTNVYDDLLTACEFFQTVLDTVPSRHPARGAMEPNLYILYELIESGKAENLGPSGLLPALKNLELDAQQDMTSRRLEKVSSEDNNPDDISDASATGHPQKLELPAEDDDVSSEVSPSYSCDSTVSGYLGSIWNFGFPDSAVKLDPCHPYMPVKNWAVDAVVRSYVTQAGMNDGDVGSSGVAVSSNQSNGTSNKNVENHKRGKEHNSSEDEDAAGGGRKRRRPNGREDTLEGESSRLACHFQKRDPVKYLRCGISKSGWVTVSHVKQHLKRSHVQDPNYCSRCKAVFKTAFLKDQHVNSNLESTIKCPEREFEDDGKLPYEINKQLSPRCGSKLTIEQQWFSIWDLVFPGVQRPSSCYVDLTPAPFSQVLLFQAYFMEHGPAITLQVLRDHGVLINRQNSNETLAAVPENQSFFNEVFRHAFRRIVSDWRSEEAPELPVPTTVVRNVNSTLGTSDNNRDPTPSSSSQNELGRNQDQMNQNIQMNDDWIPDSGHVDMAWSKDVEISYSGSLFQDLINYDPESEEGANQHQESAS